MKIFIFLIISLNAFSQHCDVVKSLVSNPHFSRPFFKNEPSLHSNYDQKFIHINIEANDSNTYIISTVNYKIKSKENGLSQIYFEFSPNFTVDSVKVNGNNCNFYHSNDSLIINPCVPFPPHTDIDVSISYRGTASSGFMYRGLVNTYSQEYQQQVTWTLSQAFHLKHWLPCKQDLTDRFDSAWIFITVDSTCKAGSEGILTAITPLGNGKVRYEWKERHPIVYYLLSIAVGKYIEYSFKTHIPGATDSILVMNYIYNNPQCLIDNKTDIDRTADFLRIFSNCFGLYPFHEEKYGHCQVPLPGGMEHQTMTSLGYFIHWLVAHELAHQWFGNNITCASWQDIWINEGFASYAEYIALQYYFDQQTADATIRHFQYRARLEPEGSVYVPFEDIHNEARIFNSNLSYKKGAAIIHMLRYLCENDSIFFTGLKQLNTIYKDSILTGEDVKNLYETLTGKSLDNFFDQFYYGKGYPIYNIICWQDSINNTWSDINIKIQQRGSSPDNNLFTIPLPIKLVFENNNDTIVKLSPTLNIQTFNIPSNHKKLTSIIVDPQDWILDSLESVQISINKIQFDNQQVFIYPNPVKQTFNIYCAKNNSSCTAKLYNMQMQLIEKQQIQYFPYIYRLQNNYAKGVYFLELCFDDLRIVKKIIID